jgi:hypothetical protein
MDLLSNMFLGKEILEIDQQISAGLPKKSRALKRPLFAATCQRNNGGD